MKLTCFYVKGETHVGVVLPDGGILDATAAGVIGSIGTIISMWDIFRPQLVRLWRDESLQVLQPEQLSFAPVADANSKIICVGFNYHSHIEESEGSLNTARGEYPIIFSKFSDCLVGHRQNVWLPTHLESTFDYEAELVVVVGKAGSEIPVEQALRHVFGYTCGNDVSIRAVQNHSSQWLVGKSYPGFAPVGPYIATEDTVDVNDLNIKCMRGEKQVQSGNTSQLIFSVPEIISYVSRYIPLRAGDLIFTGTPSGAIVGQPEQERKWLQPGETVTVEIDGIGALSTTFVG